MRHPRTFTAEDHRAAAADLLEQTRDNPDALPEQRTALATAAVAYALLALRPADQPPARPPINAAGVLTLAVLCGTVIAVVWLLTR